MYWLYGFIEATQKSSESTDDINPRWAYLGFGAPWLNLFLPYRIVVTLLNSFDDLGDSGRRLNTQTIAALWWALHITYFLLAPISFLLFHYQDLVDAIDLSYSHTVMLFVFNSLLVLGVSRCAQMQVSKLEPACNDNHGKSAPATSMKQARTIKPKSPIRGFMIQSCHSNANRYNERMQRSRAIAIKGMPMKPHPPLSNHYQST